MIYREVRYIFHSSQLRKPRMNPWGQAARQVQFKKRIRQIVWMPQGLFETIHWYLATENKLLKASPTALTHNCHLRAVVSCVASSRNVSKTGCWTTSRCIQRGKLKLRHWHLILENFTGTFFLAVLFLQFLLDLKKVTNPSKQKTKTLCWHAQRDTINPELTPLSGDACWCHFSSDTRCWCPPEGMKGSWRHTELACQLGEQSSRLKSRAAEVFSIARPVRPLYSLVHSHALLGWVLDLGG